MKIILACCIMAIALSGCVTKPPLDVKPEAATVKLHANAPKDRLNSDITTKTTIRAFKVVSGKDNKATQVEVAGAQCTLRSDHLFAKITTPQKVVLPKYIQKAKLQGRGVPPSILVKCTQGDLKGQSLLTAKPGKIISGSGILALDILLIAGSAAAAATADWRYAEYSGVLLQ